MKNKIRVISFLTLILLLSACATDKGKKAATQTVFQPVVQVVTRNYQPVFTSTAPDVAGINLAYNYNFSVLDFDSGPQPLSMTVNAADTCGGALTDNGDGTGNYSFTPTTAQLGTQCVVGLTASDGETPTNQNTTVDIGGINAPPYFTSTAPANATEGALYTYNITVADDNVPAQPLTITPGIVDICGGVVTDNGDGTGTYTFTPGENQGGTICLMSLTVTDSMSANADQNTVITIAETNSAPSFTSTAPTTATEGVVYVYTATVTDPDMPFQALTCSINGSDTCGGALVGCAYSFTPTEAQGGTSCVVGMTVTDNGAGALSANQNTTVNIAEDNKTPSFTTIAPTTATESVLYSYAAGVTDPDVPAQILTCSTNTFNTCGGTLTGCAYSFTPSELQGGASCIVGIKVTDSMGASADQNSLVSITEVNSAPSFTSTAPTSATEGILYSYTATVTDPDMPFQALTCSINGSDTCGGALVGCAYSFTPTEAQGGTNCTVGMRVTDNGSPALSADQNTAVAVAETNNPPAWSSAPTSIIVLLGATYNSVNGVALDTDLPAQMLTCSKVGADTCAGFDVTVTGSSTSPVSCNLSFTAGASPETCSVDVQVDDGNGSMVTDTISITVRKCSVYVDDSATGANDGSSWANAYTVLQDGVNAASSSACDVWVAEGTYKRPVGGNEPVLTMADGVKIYGGFAGTEITLSERGNPFDFPTILDGETLSYHVVIGANNALLDGFYIINGYANGGLTNDYGGGMYNDGKTNLTVDNCTFSGNSSWGSPGYGGGMYNLSSSPTITNCTFSGNLAINGYGGGMYNLSSSPTITNCIFSGNASQHQGGGISNNLSSPTITNCTFSGNSAGFGGGMNSNQFSFPTIKNSIMWGDTASSGPEIYDWSTTTIVTYSDIGQVGYAGSNGNIYSNPLFELGPFGNYYLTQATSPCVNTGDPVSSSPGGTTSTTGEPDTGIVDMGYHYPIP